MANVDICAMRYLPEHRAMIYATNSVQACLGVQSRPDYAENYKDHCDENSAYIKQRWGY